MGEMMGSVFNKEFLNRVSEEAGRVIDNLIEKAYDEGHRDAMASLKTVQFVKTESDQGISYVIRLGRDIYIDIPDPVKKCIKEME